ncbi:MAG TPA: 30S ribosome-binding factor RbfA [Bacteroidota bacterium]|nr:30S ribosome-binding factor RbfA [Bacteroidota bacterium]
MSIRTERVASLIKEEIGALVLREFSGTEYGFITVTDVRMTPDLKIARVYFSVFGTAEKQMKTMAMLEEQKQHIRGWVAHRVRLKFTPALQFYQDTTMEEVDRINRLIKKIHEHDDSNETNHESGTSS